MRITFFVRDPRSKVAKASAELPLIIRLRNGQTDIWNNTRLSVNPAWWDKQRQQVRARLMLSPELRQSVDNEVAAIRQYVTDAFYDCNDQTAINHDWLAKVIAKYYREKNRKAKETVQPVEDFSRLFDMFLDSKVRADSRRKQYLVVKRILLRFEMYKRHTGKPRYKLDVRAIDKITLEEIAAFIRNEYQYFNKYPDLYALIPDKKTAPKPRGNNTMCDLMKKLRAFFNWCENAEKIDRSPFRNFSVGTQTFGTPFYLTKEEMLQVYHFDFGSVQLAAGEAEALEKQRDIFIFQCSIGCRVGDLLRLTKRDIVNGALEYIPTKTISENGRTVIVPLNKTAKAILNKYSYLPGDRLLPFAYSQQYNQMIRQILRVVGINRLVTILDPLTGKEEKKPICEVAASHMARRTFIGNLYKQVQDPNIVGSLSGHVDGSRAFSRYREIDREIKTTVVQLLDE